MSLVHFDSCPALGAGVYLFAVGLQDDSQAHEDCPWCEELQGELIDIPVEQIQARIICEMGDELNNGDGEDEQTASEPEEESSLRVTALDLYLHPFIVTFVTNHFNPLKNCTIP